MRRFFTLVVFLSLIGCHHSWQKSSEPWDGLSFRAKRVQIVSNAHDLKRSRRYQINHRRFSYDCSGFVGAALFKSGIDVFGGASELEMKGNGVALLRQFVSRYGSLNPTEPDLGDLVFFSNTYDRNRDRKWNDTDTHVGIIESMDEDGTIHFIHHLNGKVARYVMNLQYPHQFKSTEGKILNSYLRRRGRKDRQKSRYLSSQLFAGFGSLMPAVPEDYEDPPRLTESVQSNTPWPAK